MHTGFQVIFDWIITFMIILLTVMFGMAIFAQNNNQQTANSAVQSALMAARNDDGRMVRGVFVVDRAKFMDYIEHSNVPYWHQNRFKDNDGKNALRFKVQFIPDTSEEAVKFNHNDDRENKNDLAIKAVKLVVFDSRKKQDGHYYTVDSVNFTISSHVVNITDDMTDDRHYNNDQYLYNYYDQNQDKIIGYE